MQTLKFEVACLSGEFEKGRDAQRIVGSELREKARPQGKQFSRTGDVIEVSHRLASEDGISVKSALLCAFDLGVPIGALDQAHHHAPTEAACQRIDIIDHLAGAL